MDPDDFFMHFDEIDTEILTGSRFFKEFGKMWMNANYGQGSSNFWSDSDSEPEDWHPRDQITLEHPTDGFVDGGYILAETITITKRDYVEMTSEEWIEIQSYVEEFDNFVVNHIPTGTPGEEILHVVDLVPTITTMAA